MKKFLISSVLIGFVLCLSSWKAVEVNEENCIIEMVAVSGANSWGCDWTDSDGVEHVVVSDGGDFAMWDNGGSVSIIPEGVGLIMCQVKGTNHFVGNQ